MSEFHISNSLLHNWEDMCPRVFKARHIDKLPEAEFKTTEDMRWGLIFETMAIGAAVGGKKIEADEREKMSIFYPRIKAQAMKVRQFLKRSGLKVIERQAYHHAVIRDAQMNEVRIMGGMDLLCERADGTRVIIDIKLTGDTENDFGKFSWGSPEKMDLSQSIHYTILHEAVFDQPCEFKYWVFDKGKEVKQAMINIEISDAARYHHIERISQAYHEITFAIATDDWGYKNTYDKCSVCPVKCKNERVLPEEQTVRL